VLGPVICAAVAASDRRRRRNAPASAVSSLSRAGEVATSDMQHLSWANHRLGARRGDRTPLGRMAQAWDVGGGTVISRSDHLSPILVIFIARHLMIAETEF
jgi:hypothetical protein